MHRVRAGICGAPCFIAGSFEASRRIGVEPGGECWTQLLVYSPAFCREEGRSLIEPNRHSRWLAIAALCVFALSGCSGLIYQSIWSQYLGLYLGHAAYAQSLVLAIYMGGMALGAWWASRRSLRWANLLRVYAIVELAIGFAAMVFHAEYVALTNFAYDTAFPALQGAGPVQLFKWSSGALLILPQAVMLGMTFPLMSNALMRRLGAGQGAILGGLYFTNSAGAAIGALLATFMLLPTVGLPGAMRTGAILNIVVAAIAFALAARRERIPEPHASVSSERRQVPALLLLAAAITGATSFVYEIGWVRMLSLALGTTVHAFELMLAAFIGGLACGGWWVRRRIDGYSQPARIGGWVQLLMGLAALGSLLLYDHSFDWVAWFMRALSRNSDGYTLYNWVSAIVAVLIMAPAAFFAGMTLPLFTLAMLRDGGGEASIGRIYAANTLGAIVGVFAAVHLLIPGLGLKLAMSAAAAGDLLLGIVLLRRTRIQDTPDFPYLGAAISSALALALVFVVARFDPNAMAGGVFRHGSARITDAEGKVIFYRDGKTASVAAIATSKGTVSIATNGKVDAAIQVLDDKEPSPDEATMIMSGALPLLYHPAPKTAAVIGFGSGLTTHTLLSDPRLERVDTIEIEPAMVAGARAFGDRVKRAYSDPRSHVYFEDAKTYFSAHKARYDLIVSEPSNPWVSGVANLFSREFYRFLPRHMAPKGLFVQWVQVYEINDELIATVVRALSESFSDYHVYLTTGSDMLIVARADGLLGEINGDVLRSPMLAPLMARVGVPTLADIATHRVGDRHSLEAWFDSTSARVSSDFHPILSLEAPRARFETVAARRISNFPLADLPYREVLGGLSPVSLQSLAHTSSYRYSSFVRRAVAIATSMRSNGFLADADLQEDAARLAYLREVFERCRLAESTIVQDEMLILAGLTIPFLQASDIEDAWSDPKWGACTGQPELKAIHATIAAVAQRDWAHVLPLATNTLTEHGKSLSPYARDWLLRAAMLGAIAVGNYSVVADLDLAIGKDVEPQGDSLSYRAYMLTFAAQQAEKSAVH